MAYLMYGSAGCCIWHKSIVFGIFILRNNLFRKIRVSKWGWENIVHWKSGGFFWIKNWWNVVYSVNCRVVKRVIIIIFFNPDTDDQKGASKKSKSEGWILGSILAKVQVKEFKQTKEATEEEREKGIHTVPSSAAWQQGTV